MNREIKFRAWDGNRIRDVFKILFTETTGLIVYFTATESGKEPGHLIEQDSRLKLMQYTGLKDSDGKEIYEGDIVEANGSKTILVKDNSDARKFVSPIFKNQYKSDNGRFLFIVYWQNCFSQFNFNSLDQMVSIECNVGKRDFEIIGNIYENPELLK